MFRQSIASFITLQNALKSLIEKLFSFDDKKNERLGCNTLKQLILQELLNYDKDLATRDNLDAFHHLNLHSQNIVICPMSKDSETETNNPTIPYIGETLREFFASQSHPDKQNYTLLIPLLMCRGFCRIPSKLIQRAHAVLVIVEVKDNQLTLCVHDSCAKLWEFFYPDKLKHFVKHADGKLKLSKVEKLLFKDLDDEVIQEELARINEELDQEGKKCLDDFISELKSYTTKDIIFNRYSYIGHKLQESTFECGYFVMEMIAYYLRDGATERFSEIKIDLEGGKNKYLADHGVSLFDPTEITQVGGINIVEDIEDEDEFSLVAHRGEKGYVLLSKSHPQAEVAGELSSRNSYERSSFDDASGGFGFIPLCELDQSPPSKERRSSVITTDEENDSALIPFEFDEDLDNVLPKRAETPPLIISSPDKSTMRRYKSWPEELSLYANPKLVEAVQTSAAENNNNNFRPSR